MIRVAKLMDRSWKQWVTFNSTEGQMGRNVLSVIYFLHLNVCDVFSTE